MNTSLLELARRGIMLAPDDPPGGGAALAEPPEWPEDALVDTELNVEPAAVAAPVAPAPVELTDEQIETLARQRGFVRPEPEKPVVTAPTEDPRRAQVRDLRARAREAYGAEAADLDGQADELLMELAADRAKVALEPSLQAVQGQIAPISTREAAQSFADVSPAAQKHVQDAWRRNNVDPVLATSTPEYREIWHAVARDFDARNKPPAANRFERAGSEGTALTNDDRTAVQIVEQALGHKLPKETVAEAQRMRASSIGGAR